MHMGIGRYLMEKVIIGHFIKLKNNKAVLTSEKKKNFKSMF